MKRSILSLVLFFFVTQFCAQLPNFFEVEIEHQFVVKEFDQDSMGIIWIAANAGVYKYNGYQCVEVESFSNLDFKTVSIACYEQNVYVGLSDGKVRVYDSRSGLFSYEFVVVADKPITDIVQYDQSNLLIAAYGSGLYNFQTQEKSATPWNLSLRSPYIQQISLGDEYLAIASDDGFDLHYRSGEPVPTDFPLPQIICTSVFTNTQGEIWFTDYEHTVYSLSRNLEEITTYAIESVDQIYSSCGSETEFIVSTDVGVFWRDTESPDSAWIKYSKEINRAGALYIDDEYNLWVGDDKSGIWKSCLYIREIPGSLESQIQTIQIVDENLWLGTSEGLYSTPQSTWNPRLVIPQINITCFAKIDAKVLVGTYDSGLFLYDSDFNLLDDFNTSDGLGDNSILALEVTDQTAHVASLHGVYHMTIENARISQPDRTSSLQKNYVLSMEPGVSGGMWCGNHKTGISFVGAADSLSIKVTSDSVKIGSVNSIVRTSDDVIWFSSENNGLMKIVNNKLETWESPHGSKSNYTSIIALKDGALLLIGDASVDLYYPDNHELISFAEEVGISEMRGYFNNYSTDESRIWFVHDNKLWVFENAPQGTRTRVNTLIDKVEVNLNQIPLAKSMFEEEENNFTFTFTGVLHRNAERLFYSYKLEGFDEDWRITQDRLVSYPKLPPGEYVFRVISTHDEFAIHEDATSYEFEIKRAFYHTIWFWLLIIALAGLLATYLIARSRKRQRLEAELAQKRTETQLINLKSQLNPHFMFNSFNTMIGLIEEDPPRGIHFIEYLTDFYRGVLEIGQDELIPFSKEVELVELYVHLLQERHGDGLVITWEGEPTRGMIPPLSLQMLLENAVKHNVVSSSHPLEIQISISAEKVVVRNSLKTRSSSGESFGIGLNNIKRRYELLSDKEINIEVTAESFEVELPLIS